MLRAFTQLRTTDQWLRCDHVSTTVDEDGVVTLAWTPEPVADGDRSSPPWGAGLAVDSACRIYHSLPNDGRILVYRGVLDGDPQPPTDLLEPLATLDHGDFAPHGGGAPRFIPRAMVVDHDDHLFVVDAASATVAIIDIFARSIVRRVQFEGGAIPRDVALDGDRVLVLTDGAIPLWILDGSRPPRPLLDALDEPFTRPAAWVRPSRLAVRDSDAIFVLDEAGAAGATVYEVRTGASQAEPYATDVAIREGDQLVVARGPGEDFVVRTADERLRLVAAPLRARAYDGLGIIVIDDVVYFFSDKGIRRAINAPVRYDRRGRLTSFLLDAKAHQTQWGRLFIDACVPPGTTLSVACITLDELPDTGPFAPRRAPPGLAADVAALRAPELSPPMPLAELVPPDHEALPQRLHRRAVGAEQPWATTPEGYETYEAPIDAPPGRYLWLVIELTGNGRRSPQVRHVRAEHPSHDLLKRLPKVFSRDAMSRDFLRRYLAMFEGHLYELQMRAAFREVLLDPSATPKEALAWLAGFVGLMLDDRLDTEAKRVLVEEATRLFRFRGTPAMLQRLLEIAIGVEPRIIERYRLRGVGGAWLGGTDDRLSTSVVGVGLRVGGRVGQPGSHRLEDAPADAFKLHAHRFVVVVPTALDGERRALVEDLIRIHRPAHTLFELCTVSQGMRVGVGLHVGMTSLVGHSSGFAPMTVGQTTLGRDGVLGRPRVMLRVGGDAVGDNTRIG